MSDDEARLARELDLAEAELARLRGANTKLATTFREEPTEENRELLKRAATSLANARDAVDAAKAAFDVMKKTGSPYGLLAEDGRVVGSIAVLVKPGTSSEDREKAIDEVLADELEKAAQALGAVLSAAPEHFTRERPGRDEEGRTVLEVSGRVEGDRLIPAVSRAAKKRS